MLPRPAPLALLLILLAPASAGAQEAMHMQQSFPAANAIMDGRNTRFSVMFDGPVDHKASRLTIEQGGTLVQTLQPRLNSQPNTLYSDGHRLPPGDYTLNWDVHGLRGGSAGTGSVPFRVAPPR